MTTPISFSKKHASLAWQLFYNLSDAEIQQYIKDGRLAVKNVKFLKVLKSKMSDPSTSAMASALLFGWKEKTGKYKTFHLRIAVDFIKFEHWVDALQVAEDRGHFKGSGTASEIYALFQGRLKYDSEPMIKPEWVVNSKREAFDALSGSEYVAEEDSTQTEIIEATDPDLVKRFRRSVLNRIDAIERQCSALRKLLSIENETATGVAERITEVESADD